VYINVALAMAEGVQFRRSANGVILTEGLGGLLPPRLFARAVRLSDGAELPFQRAGSD
jgi:RNA:NAD 2'-phosphotransferase (TPT1/KptA family)